MQTDYYKTLQVDPEASPEVIEAAFRRLALMYHPDKYGADGGQQTAEFAEINAAYAVLRDPVERRIYDIKHADQKLKSGSSGRWLRFYWRASLIVSAALAAGLHAPHAHEDHGYA